MQGDTDLAWIGEIHPELAAELDSREPLVAAELDITNLLKVAPAAKTFAPISAFPAVTRDVSLVVDETTSYDKLMKTIRAAGGNSLESCTLIDLYRGASIGADKKSLTFSLRFRHQERTLKDTEVEQALEKIKTGLHRRFQM